MALQEKLMHPVTKKPYVKRWGGINNSPEGRAVSFLERETMRQSLTRSSAA